MRWREESEAKGADQNKPFHEARAAEVHSASIVIGHCLPRRRCPFAPRGVIWGDVHRLRQRNAFKRTRKLRIIVNFHAFAAKSQNCVGDQCKKSPKRAPSSGYQSGPAGWGHAAGKGTSVMAGGVKQKKENTMAEIFHRVWPSAAIAVGLGVTVVWIAV